MKSILTISLVLFSMFLAQPMIAQKKPLRHVVSFKFAAEATDAQIDALIAAFADLQNKIPEVQSFEWGINNSPEGLDKGLTHCFILTFKNEADRDVYLPHPAHKAFIKDHGSIVADVFVIDYYAREGASD